MGEALWDYISGDEPEPYPYTRNPLGALLSLKTGKALTDDEKKKQKEVPHPPITLPPPVGPLRGTLGLLSSQILQILF